MNEDLPIGWIVMKCTAEQMATFAGLIGEDIADERRAFYDDSHKPFRVVSLSNGELVRVFSTERSIQLLLAEAYLPPMTVEQALGLAQAMIDAAEVISASRITPDPKFMAESDAAVQAAQEQEDRDD